MYLVEITRNMNNDSVEEHKILWINETDKDFFENKFDLIV